MPQSASQPASTLTSAPWNTAMTLLGVIRRIKLTGPEMGESSPGSWRLHVGHTPEEVGMAFQQEQLGAVWSMPVAVRDARLCCPVLQQ